VGTGASRGIDGARQKQFGGLFVDVFGGAAGLFGKLEGAVPVGQANHCFGKGTLGAVAHAGCVGSGAQEHAEGGDDHGTSR